MLWDSLPVVAHPWPCHGQSYEWRRRKLAPVCTGLAFSVKTPLREWDSRRRLDQKSPLSIDSELSPYS